MFELDHQHIAHQPVSNHLELHPQSSLIQIEPYRNIILIKIITITK
jgi:hypothetical protein